MSYPAKGYTLAPQLLAPWLDVPVPAYLDSAEIRDAGINSLSDLSAKVWDILDNTKCIELAEQILSRVKSLLPARGGPIRDLRLRSVDPTVTRELLEKTRGRTANQLWRGLGHALDDGFVDRTIADVMALKNFGVRSLLELLVVLETLPDGQPDNTAAEDAARVRLASQEKRTRGLLRKIARFRDSKRILSNDPRLGTSVKRIWPRATSLAEAIELRLGALEVKRDPTLLRDLSALFSCISTLKSYAADEELSAVCAFAGSPRNVNVFMHYYGFDGSGGATLQSVGDSVNLTRERVRQIIKKTAGRVITTAYMPVLERSLRFLRQRLPASVTSLELDLRAAGLLSGQFDIQGLCAANVFFSRQFDIDLLDDGATACRAIDLEAVGTIVSEAKAICSHDGAGSVSAVRSRLNLDARRFTEEKVAALLNTAGEIVWLEDRSWFYFQTSRNRLRNYVRKMLCVAESLHVGEIRAGLARSIRIDITPPKRVILAACKAFADFVESSGRISLAHDAPQYELFGIEKTLHEVLSAHGGVCSREKLEVECLKLGMNRNSFYQYLSYSPIIDRLAEGVYALRGTQVPPGLVLELGRRKSREGSVLVDYGWKDGLVWFGYCISAGMHRSGVYSVPSAFSELVSGEFEFRNASSALIWRMRNRGAAGWSLSRLFSTSDVEVGDYLVLSFDLKTRVGSAQLGSHELLLSFSDQPSAQDEHILLDGSPDVIQDSLLT